MYNEMCLQWKDLNYSIHPERKKTLKFWKWGKREDCIPILKNVSGCMNTGELIAVLGPSGAGKTTLLAAVSQRLRGDVQGDIFLNGNAISREEIGTISSFLPQFDIPVQALTAFEHLFFMAHFKMDKITTKEQKIQKINSLLVKVGLSYASGTPVRCMSGGERKRLSLAEELITDPPFVFCDEPTTGLDSFNAFSVVSTLRQLTAPKFAATFVPTYENFEMQIIPQEEMCTNVKNYNLIRQRAGIMCSIHQPTSDVFELFTHIILLEEGRVLYYGSSDDACLFFSKLGFFCPLNCNPAEFYVNIATNGHSNNLAEIVRNNFEQELSKTCSVQWLTGSSNNFIKALSRRKIGWCSQVFLLVLRTAIESKRSFKEGIASAVFFMITSAILAIMYSNVRSVSQSSIQDIEGCFFMITTELIFSFSYGVTYIFPSQLPVMRRGVGENTYSLSAYYVAQALSIVPKAFIISFIFFGLIYVSVGFSKGFVTYLTMSLTLSLSSVTGMAYGMLISSIFESDKIATELATPFDILFLLFGGLYLNINSVPYLKYVSMFYYSNEALAYDYWTTVDSIECPPQVQCLRNGTEVLVNKAISSDLDAFLKIAAGWQNNSPMEAFDKKNEMQHYLTPAMNMYKKRERTQNWAHQEKKFLLDLCRKDMRIIENKRLDAGLTAIKNKAWKIIHQRFCAAFGTDRTCNRLKEQWRRMKACTRNEIMDYNTRVARYGQEIADRKRPSPFTFEIWEFMQEAKRVCKNEALDGVDYSKVPLALEEGLETNEMADNDNNANEECKGEQTMCEVNIKEETESDNDGATSTDRLSSPHDNLPENQMQNHYAADPVHVAPSFTINNIAATLETLNALRNQFPLHSPVGEPPAKRPCISVEDTNPDIKAFMEMQAKEHMMRMQILEVQLQTAKYNRDIVEINKTIALQKLHDLANRRLS